MSDVKQLNAEINNYLDFVQREGRDESTADKWLKEVQSLLSTHVVIEKETAANVVLLEAGYNWIPEFDVIQSELTRISPKEE